LLSSQQKSPSAIQDCENGKRLTKGKKGQKQLHDPDGKEIVDFIHASEYLGKIANAIHGEDTKQAGKCYGCMKTMLRRCGGKPVLSALIELSQTHVLKELTEAITY
jgi:hypothetical protein